MYPYRNRMRWIVAGRYAHLLKALDRRRNLQDSVLEARLEAMRVWGRVRMVVIILLSIGLLATTVAWIARFMPAFEAAVEAIVRIATTASYLSGALTLTYLFLTRLLGQLEADILALLALDLSERP